MKNRRLALALAAALALPIATAPAAQAATVAIKTIYTTSSSVGRSLCATGFAPGRGTVLGQAYDPSRKVWVTNCRVVYSAQRRV